MRIRPVLSALPAALLAGAVAAQSVVLPAAATQWQGRWGQTTLFYHNAWDPGVANEARTQLIYDLAEVGDLHAVRAIAVRSWSEPVPNRSGRIELQIRMSTSPQDPNRPSHVFASNEGPAPVLVFSGPVELPATTVGPWPPPWSVLIPLQTPFALAPAPGDRALVIDSSCWNSTVGEPWLTELYDTDVGLMDIELVQGECLGANGSPQLSASVSSELLIAGGYVGLLLGMYPNQRILENNALAIGLRGAGGSYLGMTLPFPLRSIGMPAPENCQLGVEPLAAVPMSFSASGGQGFLDTGNTLPIPNDPSLVGVRLVVQNLALMQFSTGVQVFPSMTLGLTIRSGEEPNGTTVSSAGNRNAATGFPSYRWPVAIELRG